ncbi:hypothetical protein CROQUDRAFT_54044 [Cronartium quercuum f. sp. fusiforme G11]|uniref:Uncharacterized protein n=1 Tax=Cronartium quercuum f. sp. fusiforme G11 TaxID=708437 RepID=A0A9P6N6D4_9BASI|nr:hypothetical protein CROQUDRAFT_54044 [Cronartium quercuum f. sp. fusiforme G11]
MPFDPLFICYLLLSFLCAFINIAPTISHLSQGHSGPASFGIWVVLLNAINFASGLLWPDDAMNRAPLFCDITAKLNMVGPLGLLLSNACIIRYLASIFTPNKRLDCYKTLKRRMIADYIVSFGFPVLVVLASLTFQVARYEVVKLVGCSNVSALSWPAILLSFMWSPITCGVSCGYAIYVLYHLIRQHMNIRKLVQESRTPLNISRFIRMCALATTYLCISAPYTIFGTVTALYDIGPYVPWNSWYTIHNEANELSSVRQNPLYQLHFRDWLAITAGLTVFFFFSFANESLIMYSKLYQYARLEYFIPRVWLARVLPARLTKSKRVSNFRYVHHALKISAYFLININF